MTVKLLTEQHLVFISFTGGCTGSSEFALVKMPHCWKSHVAAHMTLNLDSIVILVIQITYFHLHCIDNHYAKS